MAYNLYKGLENIYNAKLGYGNAATDDERNMYKSMADKERNEMAGQGYGDWASRASAYGADANAVKKMMNEVGKKGKTATRDYMYSLGQNYGLSSSQMDNLIKWDNDTQQLYFGGKLVGTPDSVVDGVSYWNDTSILDNAFNDYVKRSGTAAPATQLMNQNNQGVKDKVDELWGLQTGDHNSNNQLWKQEYEDLKKTNPFTTDEAKAILSKYDLAGLQGRDNAAAIGSASNGGNIDSYAAANALRQQAALVNQGQMAVLESYQKKLDNARALLEGMGIQQQNSYKSMQDTIGIQQTEAQRLFDNKETELNNKTERMRVQAEVSGYTPREWVYSNNPYFNSDGTLNDVYMTDTFDNTGGFTTIINNAKEKLKTTTDENERANLQATINYATQAKAYKTYNNAKYSPYAHEVEGIAPEHTANYTLENKKIDSGERISMAGYETDKYINDADNEAAYKSQQSKQEHESSENEKEREHEKEMTENSKNNETVDVVDLSDFIGKITANENPYGVDEFGVSLLNKLLEYAQSSYNNTTMLTEEELLNKVVEFSAECHTDKRQIAKVFDSLGVKISLDGIEDRDVNDWTKGVKWKLTK